MQELDFGLPPVPTHCLHENPISWQPTTSLAGTNYAAHRKKKKQMQPTREAGGGMRRNSCEALVPVFKPDSKCREQQNPKKKKKGHDRLA